MNYDIQDSPFPIGSTIYIITGINSYEEAIVKYVDYWFCQNEDLLSGFPRGIITQYLFIKLSGYIADERRIPKELEIIPFDLIFDSEEEAKEMSTLVPLYNLTKEEWINAIGDLDNDNFDYEDCELGVGCCSSISLIRRLLNKGRLYNGLIKMDIKMIQNVIRDHPLHIEHYEKSILKKIFDNLGVTLN